MGHENWQGKTYVPVCIKKMPPKIGNSWHVLQVKQKNLKGAYKDTLFSCIGYRMLADTMKI